MINNTWREAFDLSGLQPATRTAVEGDLNASIYDYSRMVPNIQAGNGWAAPATTIPVEETDLSNFAQFAAEHGYRDHEHFHAIYYDPRTGERVTEHISGGAQGFLDDPLADDVRPAVAGLYWYAGPMAPRIQIERTLATDFKRAVMSAEKAHAQDFYDLWQTALWARISTMMGSDGHIWLPDGQRGAGGTAYQNLHGENWMAWHARSFDPTIDFGAIQLVHPISEEQAAQVRALAPWILQEEQPPEEPPVEPEPEPDVLMRDENGNPLIWDARPYVTKPEGVGPLSAEGDTIHHTGAAAPAFDATMKEDIDYIKAIDRLHRANPNIIIGFAYHGITMKSGRSFLTGNPDGQRAHIANMNDKLRGWCIAGDLTDEMPTEGVLRAHARLIKFGGGGVGLPVKGHSEWGTATACPGTLNGFDWSPYLDGPGDTTDPSTGWHVTHVVVNPDEVVIIFSERHPEYGIEWHLRKTGISGEVTYDIAPP